MNLCPAATGKCDEEIKDQTEPKIKGRLSPPINDAPDEPATIQITMKR
jgi:hypothetical protein